MKRMFIVLISAAALISCGKEPVSVEISTGQSARFKINEIDTKAFLSDGYKICWEAEKDQVSIFAKTDNCRFTAIKGGDDSFWLEGTLSQVTGKYYALYPYDPDATNSTGFVTTTLPTEQKAVVNQFSNIIAVGSTEGKTLNFRNCVTLVEVDLQTDGIKTISMRGNNGELIAGTVRISIPSKDEGVPVSTVVKGDKEVSISDGTVLQKGKYYLAVIPQTFSRGITLTLEGDGIRAVKSTTKPVTASRSMRLLTGGLDLQTVSADDSFCLSYDDGNQSGTIYPGEDISLVYSYSGVNSFNYTIKSSGYTAEYFLDGSESGADASAIIGAGFSGASGTVDLSPTLPSGGENDNNTRLKSASIRGTKDSPIDLSTDNNIPGVSLSGVNTANCYVVRAPGWYSFPLVYGNAIEGGNDNSKAYAPGAASASMLSPFIDAKGNGISSPYIGGVAGARLEWEDALCLIDRDISVYGGSGTDARIRFYVPAETIREGNAMISALDAQGKVLWSWHIWVCGASDSELSPVTITNKAGNDFRFMRINLGWVAPYDTPVVYPERRTRVRLTENGSGKSIQFTLVQLGASLPANELGNCTFYEGGRKDPFVGSNGTDVKDARGDNIKKIWYTTARRDTIGTRAALLGNDIAAFISNPTVYNIDSGGDKKYSNLWNATQDKADGPAYSIVKTIYDPCPAGLSLPPVSAWSAFSTTNTDGEFNKGWNFWSKPNKEGETVFYPACGSMSTSNNTSTSVFGSLRNVGTHLSYWAGNGKNTTSTYYLSAYHYYTEDGKLMSSVATNYGNNRQAVLPIRPCFEQ